ncbi:extensin-like [Fopius arisanus]|uniref:Extensin-like n=1 Tax=Fopius arisanus TaxID=64838 RepID=A0A9R1TPH3_9HYME|nr:PREDICTED: extensin-like [Fopius arisanus]
MTSKTPEAIGYTRYILPTWDPTTFDPFQMSTSGRVPYGRGIYSLPLGEEAPPPSYPSAAWRAQEEMLAQARYETKQERWRAQAEPPKKPQEKPQDQPQKPPQEKPPHKPLTTPLLDDDEVDPCDAPLPHATTPSTNSPSPLDSDDDFETAPQTPNRSLKDLISTPALLPLQIRPTASTRRPTTTPPTPMTTQSSTPTPIQTSPTQRRSPLPPRPVLVLPHSPRRSSPAPALMSLRIP